MRNSMILVGAVTGLLLGVVRPVASEPTKDMDFVAKVSQGGMFEVEASRLASARAVAADVADFAAAEVHDHDRVGAKLKRVATSHTIAVDSRLNAEFQSRLDRLKAIDAAHFDAAYMAEMSDIHAKDGAAFAKEAREGGAADFRAFADETHRIVLRHIGAIHAAPPPAA